MQAANGSWGLLQGCWKVRRQNIIDQVLLLAEVVYIDLPKFPEPWVVSTEQRREDSGPEDVFANTVFWKSLVIAIAPCVDRQSTAFIQTG